MCRLVAAFNYLLEAAPEVQVVVEGKAVLAAPAETAVVVLQERSLVVRISTTARMVMAAAAETVELVELVELAAQVVPAANMAILSIMKCLQVKLGALLPVARAAQAAGEAQVVREVITQWMLLIEQVRL